MLIYLLDKRKDEEVEVNLNVEYTLPCSDLYIIFYSKDTTCAFEDRQVSRPVHQYQLQKVNHLMGSSLVYEGKPYSLTLGFFRSNHQFIPFVMDQQGPDPARFGTAPDYFDLTHANEVLFNYPPHPSLLSMEEETLTFQEVATRALQRKEEGNIGYSLPPSQAFDLTGLVGEREFSDYLDRESDRLDVKYKWSPKVDKVLGQENV